MKKCEALDEGKKCYVKEDIHSSPTSSQDYVNKCETLNEERLSYSKVSTHLSPTSSSMKKKVELLNIELV